ncbi:thioesterase family protein [Roseibacterium sp. SDUM158017]|uniref:thioesterase family protein n=1 Tax=Roseicyclus salinarum TaxID=3036773 RepID=UPI0024150E39|nr:thioesterase family protein [Roseibacterium sp. SDUM158017]MDG4649734.1 thioesterase family protein [Roseibacterium sp. SDUM158017]
MPTFHLHEEPLQEAWLDAYGHLNEAFYLVPFSNATWRLQDRFGIGTEYFDRTGCALYTLETHLRYLAEVRPPAMLSIETTVLGLDAKRLHIGHVMWSGEHQCATFECMALHYDTRAKRSAPFPDTVREAMSAAVPDALPDWACGSVRLL